MRKDHNRYFMPYVLCAMFALASANAAPLGEWDWHLPGDVYKELEFTDRAAVDRAVKLFQQAVDAERRGEKVTDVVPRYRAAAGEWRKVQVQGETSGEGSEPLLAYAVFMQGYARQQAHDRNEAIKLFNEVLDIYPEQKFIAVPARYMLYVVRREMGDVRQAEAALEEIVEDKAADGHPIYYNVLRSMGNVRWDEGKPSEAAEFWSKIVFSTKAEWNLWYYTRNDLALARVVTENFGELEAALFAGIDANKRKERVEAVSGSAKWIGEIDRNGWNNITHYLDRTYPRDKKGSERKKALESIRKGYIAWLDGEAPVFEGYDDGWTYALAQLRARLGYEKSGDLLKRVKALEPMVKNAKPDKIDGRARTLAMELLGIGEKEGARVAAAMAKNAFSRLRLQYDVEMALGEWKAAEMYLTEIVNAKPPPEPASLKGAKYDLASLYRARLGVPDKAVKIYQELDDPPRSLWGLAEALRESGKKNESYTTLTEIASIFPNDAPNAVLRMAQWKEQDGDKEKAIALYRRLLSHPKWKQTGASSAAHQALERFGIATGGAMTNEVR